MKTRNLTLAAFACLTLLFCLCVGSHSAQAAGGLLLFTANGSPYVTAVQYETFTSPSAHLSYATVKGQRVQIQSAGIVANIPFPDPNGIVDQDDADRMVGMTEMFAARYPQYAQLLKGVGKLWKRSLEKSKVAQSQPTQGAPPTPTPDTGPKLVAEGVRSEIPVVRTKSGQNLKHVKITRFEDDKAFISHEEGFCSLLISDISNLPAFPSDAKAAIEKVQVAVDAKRKAEADRIAAEKKEMERIAKEEEDKRLAQIEQERKAKEVEEQRLAAEKQEKERVAKEAKEKQIAQAEQDRQVRQVEERKIAETKPESGVMQPPSSIEEAKAKYNADAMEDFWSGEYLKELLTIAHTAAADTSLLTTGSRADIVASILSFTYMPNPTRQPFKEIGLKMMEENKAEQLKKQFDRMAWCAYIPPSSVRMAGMAERIALGPYNGRPYSKLDKDEIKERAVWSVHRDSTFSILKETQTESLSQVAVERLIYINELESALYMMGMKPCESEKDHACLISDLLVQAFASKNHSAFCLREDSKQLWSKIYAASEKWFPRPKCLESVSQADYLIGIYLPLVKFSKASTYGASQDVIDKAIDSASEAVNSKDMQSFYYAALGILKVEFSFNCLFSMHSLNYLEKHIATDSRMQHLWELLASHNYTKCADGISLLVSKSNDLPLIMGHVELILRVIGDPSAVDHLPSRNPAVIQDNGELELRKYYKRKAIDEKGEWKRIVGRE